MNKSQEFYTLKGYQMNENPDLTTAMEDYIEMICRIIGQNKVVRVNELAKVLHVKPSSVSKMVQQLNNLGYTYSQKYGIILLTDKGIEAGGYLLYRHSVIHNFLKQLNNSDDELEQTEKIEHFLNPPTVKNLDILTQKLLDTPCQN